MTHTRGDDRMDNPAGIPIEAAAVLKKYQARLAAVTDELLMTQAALDAKSAECDALRNSLVDPTPKEPTDD